MSKRRSYSTILKAVGSGFHKYYGIASVEKTDAGGKSFTTVNKPNGLLQRIVWYIFLLMIIV